MPFLNKFVETNQLSPNVIINNSGKLTWENSYNKAGSSTFTKVLKIQVGKEQDPIAFRLALLRYTLALKALGMDPDYAIPKKRSARSLVEKWSCEWQDFVFPLKPITSYKLSFKDKNVLSTLTPEKQAEFHQSRQQRFLAEINNRKDISRVVYEIKDNIFKIMDGHYGELTSDVMQLVPFDVLRAGVYSQAQRLSKVPGRVGDKIEAEMAHIDKECYLVLEELDSGQATAYQTLKGIVEDSDSPLSQALNTRCYFWQSTLRASIQELIDKIEEGIHSVNARCVETEHASSTPLNRLISSGSVTVSATASPPIGIEELGLSLNS